ncbi:restriction endonuclease [Arenimonas composti]|uniref:Restriction endonuclease type IV Mrr domain-containing protein n=1 Tax=Arenimonas composti TR7-09 = DSM 18010 TaxID=1121013 RepID=A0A091AY79_9GAMM|nr:restriction endonuclease [Arenimonas composti]KFN45278.1 hypothetical protein P873_02325 [Arenimonas composti TR7-09 = DSM 18010]
MFGFSPLLVALVVTVIALGVSGWWFGVHRRRLAETQAGIAALAGMKWRECAGLVLQALESKGYREAPASRQPGDGGTEFLLDKGSERVLMSYKHGTAYRLGEANVRDFANAVQLAGANSGMLVTLGSAEGFARDIARRFGIELIDGRALWPQMEPFAPAAMVEAIRDQAAGHIRRGQRAGVFASVALGILVFVAGTLGAEEAAPPVAPITGPAIEDTAPAVAAPLSPAEQASAALEELEAVNRLSDEERLQRRLAAASAVTTLEEADSAVWSTASTLVVTMTHADGIDLGLVNEACAILTQYEELRYTRLQLEPPASDGGRTPVRWRQCQ